MKRALIYAIRIYQNSLSCLMLNSCRFYPTCSDYAADAIGQHGSMRGLWLVAWRLLRCQPMSRGGYDPVR